jgi:ferrous iron transport protein A
VRAGRRRRHRRRHHAPGVHTLAAVASGRTVRVVRVGGGRRLVHRLAALGIVPGAKITVTRARGPALVSLNGTRLAVGRQAAAAVEVEETGE